MRPKVFFRDSDHQVPPIAPRRRDSDTAAALESGSEADTDVEVVPKRSHRRMESQHEIGTFKRTRTNSQSRDVNGRKELLRACLRGDLKWVSECLAKGGNPNDRDYAGTTAMHAAALQDDKRILEALLHSPGAVVDIRSGNDELDTPLMDAVSHGSVSAVKLLLDHGADPRVSNKEGKIALDFIDWDDDSAEEIEILVKAATARCRALRTPVMTRDTAPPGTFPRPEPSYVVAEVASPHLDLLTKSGRAMATHRAARGDLAFVGTALEQGWRPGSEALVKAAKYGHSEVVGLLLAFGVPVDALWEGQTALLATAGRGHSSTVKLLLDSGADRMREDAKGRTCASLVSFLPPEDSERKLLEGSSDYLGNLSGKEGEVKEPHFPTVESKHDQITPKESAEPQSNATDKSKPRATGTHKDLLQNATAENSSGNRMISDTREIADKGSKTKDFSMPFEKIDFRSIKRKKRSNSQAVHSGESTPEAEVPFVTGRPVRQRTSSSAKEESHSVNPTQDHQAESTHSESSSHVQTHKDTHGQEFKRENSEANITGTLEVQGNSKIASVESGKDSRTFPGQNSETAEHRRNTNAENIEFAARRERERRAREAQMLQSLANEERRRNSNSGSPSARPSPLSPVSETPSPGPAPEQQHRQKQSTPVQQSVRQLPWALRHLAYTGSAFKEVLPFLVYIPEGSSSPYLLDIQVSLFLGRPQLHRDMPDLKKLAVTAQQKETLWNFAKSWIISPTIRMFPSKEASEKDLFMALQLNWVKLNDLDPLLGAEIPKVTICFTSNQLKSETESPTSTQSALPLRFALRVSKNQQALAWT